MSTEDNSLSVTLNKANKLKALLKTLVAQTKVKDLSSTVEVQYEQTNPVTLDQFKAQIQSKIAEAKTNIEKYLRLNNDYRILKDLTFSANITSGVSHVLAQIENLEMQKKLYLSLLDSIEKGPYGRRNLTVDIDASYSALTREKDQYSNNNSVRRAVYQKEELENFIKDITKQIRDLEDTRDRKNGQAKVILSLSQETLEELGVIEIKKSVSTTDDKTSTKKTFW